MRSYPALLAFERQRGETCSELRRLETVAGGVVPQFVTGRPSHLAKAAAALLIAWFVMQIVHECGHVLAAWLTGGTVERVVLHPLSISRTDVSPNPHPLSVAWGGPIFGVVAPLVAFGASKRMNRGFAMFLRFFAGFCLIANGAYIGAGSFYGIGDAGDLLHHGSPRWTLIAFGAIAITVGLWIWHRLNWRFLPNQREV
jgi:hypothetical protein